MLMLMLMLFATMIAAGEPASAMAPAPAPVLTQLPKFSPLAPAPATLIPPLSPTLAPLAPAPATLIPPLSPTHAPLAPAPATLVPPLSPTRTPLAPAPAKLVPPLSPTPTPLAPAPATLVPPLSPTRTPLAPAPATLVPPLSPTLAPLSPAPGLDCTNALLNLSSCLTYVEEGSNISVPEKGCCPGLAGLVASQPICLCHLLSTSDAFGVKIDDTKALMLPTICRVETPPVSLCSALGIPVPSPLAISPAGTGQSAGSPIGSGPLAPASQINAPPSRAGDGLTAGVSALLALLTVGSQAFMAIF